MSDLFILTAVYGSSDPIKSLDEANPAIEILPPRCPTEAFFEKAAFDECLPKTGDPIASDSSWDEPLTANAPLEKHFTNPLGFTKGSIGYKLKITRTEQQIIDGEKWSYAYAGDELVDARPIES